MNICVTKRSLIRKHREETYEISVVAKDYEDLTRILDLANEFSSNRINVDFDLDYFKIDQLTEFMELIPENLVFKFILNREPAYYIEQIRFFARAEKRYFFNYAASNIDELYQLVNLRPTDIYITGELGFILRRVSSFLHKNNIRVRVIPNVAQSNIDNIDPYYCFFIRPEDLPQLVENGYIDTIEFGGDKTMEEICYKYYVKMERYPGDLDKIIQGFKEGSGYDSRRFYPDFGIERANCGKSCMLGGSCQFCQRNIAFMNNFKDKKVIIEY